jgi:dipeptidyl aminopeptidase/acylaminoacyl peptidase
MPASNRGILRAIALALATLSAHGAQAQISSGRTISARDIISLTEVGGYFGQLSVSPDQRSVAFELKVADIDTQSFQMAWYVMPVQGGPPVRVGDYGDFQFNPVPWGRINGIQAPQKPQWSPDGRWIAYLRKSAGQVQVWRAGVDGSGEEQVTHAAADVMRFGWYADGAGVYFTVGRNRELMARADREEGDRGYLLDDRFVPGYSSNPLWLACGGDAWDVPIPASQVCTPTLWAVAFGSEEHLASTEERTTFAAMAQARRPPGVNASRAIQSITWDKRGSSAAWLENEAPKTQRGYAAPLILMVDGRRCEAPECRGQLTQVWWLDDQVIFERMEGSAYSQPALYEWHPGRRAVRRIYRLDGKLESCELAQSALICLREMPSSPRAIVSVGLARHDVSTVFDPNPQFKQFVLGRIERIEWQDGFGNDAFGHLLYPPGHAARKAYPLVIVQYRSRGFLNGGVGDEYPILPLAAAGFLVLSFDSPEDWKLAAEYPLDNLKDLAALEAQEWKDGYKFRRKLNAINIILDRLIQRGLVDPARVGITGLSDGASTVDYALFNSSRFAAAAVSGDWSPESYTLQLSGPMRSFTRSFLHANSAAEALDTWKALALSAHADAAQAPLLIQVSDTELIETTPIIVALKDAGKPVDAYVFPNELHVKWQPQHKLAVAERSIDWFRFWLMNEENLAPDKAEQYARWKGLRSKPPLAIPN